MALYNENNQQVEIDARGNVRLVDGGTDKSSRFNSFFNDARSGLGDVYKNAREEALKPGGVFKNQQGQYRGAGGGKLSAGLGALETFTQDPVAGVISAPIGLAAGQVANMATNALTSSMMQGPPVLKALGMGLRFAAPAVVGYQAQKAAAGGVQSLMGGASQAAQGVTNAAAGGGGGIFGLGSGLQDLSLNLPIVGSVNIGERAKRRAESAYQRQEQLKDANASLALEQQRSNIQLQQSIAEARAINQLQTDAYLNQAKGLAPLIADQQRREGTIQQQLLNTQGSIHQRLGRMAGMFQLADRSMAESGALARTMAANSPYNAAMLPAPSISFGNA
jgi:hypothetical protein